MEKQEIARFINLCLSSLGGKPVCLCSCILLKNKGQASHSPSICFSSLTISHRYLSPPHRTPDCDTQSMAWPIQSQEWVSISIISLSSEFPPRGTSPDPITSLPFLLDYLCIFLTVSVKQESFCQFPVRFQWELFHMWKYLWRSRWALCPFTPSYWSELPLFNLHIAFLSFDLQSFCWKAKW